MISTPSLLRLAAVLSPVIGAVTVEPFDVASLSLREVGARNTLDWRIWLEKDGDPISFWHDIPLYPDESDKSIVNIYIEIPRWTQGKIETSRNEPLNPIFHDDKNDKPRFVVNVWPHRTYPFNYGSLPQTWENSNVKHPFTGYVGDNDPMDVFDISEIEPAYVGQVKQVKVLGGLAMIDDETTDWKVICVDVNDPLAAVVNTVTDLDKYRPGLRESMHDWFKYYKVVKGDGLNTIIGNDYQNVTFMTQTIEESHVYWKDLQRGRTDPGKISTRQTSNPRYCKSYITSENATAEFDIPEKADILPAEGIPDEYLYWFYLDDKFDVITLPGQVIDID